MKGVLCLIDYIGFVYILTLSALGGLFKICSAYSLAGVGDAIYAGCFDSPAGKWGHLQSCDLFIFPLREKAGHLR